MSIDAVRCWDFMAFASVAAGFCANILLGLFDALAHGFTESAAQMIDPELPGIHGN